MKSVIRQALPAILLTFALAACSNMTTSQRNTAVGAAIGGAAGHVISDGDTATTIGGAALGGVIGSQVK